jgi:hypothetical protein
MQSGYLHLTISMQECFVGNNILRSPREEAGLIFGGREKKYVAMNCGFNRALKQRTYAGLRVPMSFSSAKMYMLWVRSERFFLLRK